MNKQPGMILFFAALLLFSAAAAILGQFILAGATFAVTVGLFFFYRWSLKRRRHALTEYMRTSSEMMRRSADGDVPFPVALIQLHDGEVIWNNRAFYDLTGTKDSLKRLYVSALFPNFSFDWLRNGRSESADALSFSGRRFRVTGALLPDHDENSATALGMIYLMDITELMQVRDEYIRSRPMVCIVLVDNYDELTNNLPDAQISALNAKINTMISEWSDRYNGLLRKLERNRYLILFEAKDLTAMAEEKFSLLETMRTVLNPSGTPATVSIGIGKDGTDMREDADFAALSIEMALSRGGDQAVIKDRYDFSFFRRQK